MNEAGFEGSPPPVSAPKPAENLIKLETTVPAENVSARPAETPSPAAASSSETPAPAQPQALGEQVTSEPAIQVAGKGMSVDSMRQAVAGEVPDPTQNTLQTASENQSVASLQAAAEATPAVTIRQKVEVFADTVLQKLDGQELTPENVEAVLVEEEMAATGTSEPEAKAKVEKFRAAWKERMVNMFKAGAVDLQKWWGGDWKGVRMGDFINNFFFASDSHGGLGTEGGFEPEERSKHFTKDEFEDLLKNNPKKLSEALLRACKDGEGALFSNGFGESSTERDAIEAKLKSEQPADLLVVLNEICKFLFSNDQTEVRTKRWRVVKVQLGAALTENKKTLSDKIYKDLLLQNYQETDTAKKPLAKLLKVEATSANTTATTPAPAPSETSGSAAPEAAA